MLPLVSCQMQQASAMVYLEMQLVLSCGPLLRSERNPPARLFVMCDAVWRDLACIAQWLSKAMHIVVHHSHVAV